MRRARILAALLDALVSLVVVDAAALAITAAVWLWLPGARGFTAWIWAAAALGAIAAFLLRDASGGRARRWLALEAVGPEGRPPGVRGSIRRNLPLVVPVWNLWDAWPLLADGAAQRRTDRASGIRVIAST